MKGKQVWGLTEARDWDEETHVGEDPADKRGKNPEKFFEKFAQGGVLAAKDGGKSKFIPRTRFYRHPAI